MILYSNGSCSPPTAANKFPYLFSHSSSGFLFRAFFLFFLKLVLALLDDKDSQRSLKRVEAIPKEFWKKKNHGQGKERELGGREGGIREKGEGGIVVGRGGYGRSRKREEGRGMEKKFTYDEGEEQRSGADHSKGPNLRQNGEPRGKELLFDVPSDGKQESQRKNEQNRLGKEERKRERGKGRNKLDKNNHNDSIYREIRFQCQYRSR